MKITIEIEYPASLHGAIEYVNSFILEIQKDNRLNVTTNPIFYEVPYLPKAVRKKEKR